MYAHICKCEPPTDNFVYFTLYITKKMLKPAFDTMFTRYLTPCWHASDKISTCISDTKMTWVIDTIKYTYIFLYFFNKWDNDSCPKLHNVYEHTILSWTSNIMFTCVWLISNTKLTRVLNTYKWHEFDTRKWHHINNMLTRILETLVTSISDMI